MDILTLLITMQDEDEAAERTYSLYFVLVTFFGIIVYLANGFVSEGVLKTFLQDFGLAIFVTGVVALFVESVLDNHLVNTIRRAIEPLEGISGVVQGAEISGVKNIIARRIPNERIDDPETVDYWRDRWKRIVAAHIEQESQNDDGQIKILCATGYEFFRPNKIIQETLWKCYAKNNSCCNIKVLLLDYRSEWAKHRQQLEPGFSTITENKRSRDFLNELKLKNPNVEFKLFDWLPIALLIITKNAAFVEPYPLLKHDASQGPIGGWSPMLILRKGTEPYDVWNKHFDYIWNNPMDAAFLQYLVRDGLTRVERLDYIERYKNSDEARIPISYINAEILASLRTRLLLTARESTSPYDIFEYIGEGQLCDALKAVQQIVE